MFLFYKTFLFLFRTNYCLVFFLNISSFEYLHGDSYLTEFGGVVQGKAGLVVVYPNKYLSQDQFILVGGEDKVL